MMKNKMLTIIALTSGLMLSACGSTGSDGLSSLLALLGGGSAPAAPANLQSTGTRGQISLTWNAVAGAGGYNVYRSENGVDFTKITGDPVTAAAYDDAIASPAGDGVFYTYRVSAVNNFGESDYSATVRDIHGTRLAASYASGFTMAAEDSPYVADGTVTVDGGNFTVASGTKLYVLDNAIIDIQHFRIFYVEGLLRVLASSSAFATFTAHDADGLQDQEGFMLYFTATCVPYGSGSGTWVTNTDIKNLRYSNNAISITASVRISNCKITSNITSGGSYIQIYGGEPIIDHCSFQNNVLTINTDLSASAVFSIAYNVMRNGYYSIYFESSGLVAAGQIVNNDFHGAKSIYLLAIPNGTTIPLGGNFWYDGIGSPPVAAIEVNPPGTATVDFTTALSAAPAGAGPDW